MLQRAQQVRVSPLKSGVEEARGAHVLAFKQQRRHLAHGQGEGKAWDLGRPMRTVEGLRQRLGEFHVGIGAGRHDVVDARDLWSGGSPSDELDDVVEVNPTHMLLT